jgi:hypothetical protein
MVAVLTGRPPSAARSSPASTAACTLGGLTKTSV